MGLKRRVDGGMLEGFGGVVSAQRPGLCSALPFTPKHSIIARIFPTHTLAAAAHLYTRQKVRDPTKGSVMILNARALKGASSLAGRVITCSASSTATPGVVCRLCVRRAGGWVW